MESTVRRVLCALALCATAACTADEMLVQAEDYDRCEQTLIPPFVGTREGAGGGRMAAVRSAETGQATWLEYDVTVAGGLYEVALRAGGNNSRQAGAMSIDGGPALLVLDDPEDALPLGQALPPDAAERSVRLEQSFREHLIGSAQLTAGRHRIRVQHGAVEGRSNSFGLDWLRLRLVEASEAPRFAVGDRPEPVEGQRADVARPFEVSLLASYRFWGPEEQPRVALCLRRRSPRGVPAGTYTVELTDARDRRTVARLAGGPLPWMVPGQALYRSLTVDATDLARGTYVAVATVKLQDGTELRDQAELVLSDLSTPAWAKRARTLWVGFDIGSDIDGAVARAQQAADDGINVMVNANVLDWYGNEAISYPFRGRDADFRRFMDAVQQTGACLLMYHTMVTVGEHFYYEHKDFWGGREPYYHCSWLSAYPDSPQWNTYQAADFEYAIAKYPIDGVFLDNACAGGGPGMRAPSGEEAIAHHQEGLRAAIKRANPIGVLYPNYNTLTPAGLRTVARAWDAHMLEGQHPVPQQHRAGPAWSVSDFVTVARRVGQITGKPFWPLMYAPGQYHKLCIAACGAARGNPCGVRDRQYLHFMQELGEYLYSDDTYPAPENAVTLSPADPDLAATAAVRLYPGADSPTRDWIIQIVNGTEVDGKSVEREVELSLDVPEEDLARPAWVLRPESETAEPIALSNPLKLRAGTWTVVVIGEALLPRVRVSPALLAPVPGERTEATVTVRRWGDSSAPAHVGFVAPPGWGTEDAVGVAEDGEARLSITPPPDAVAGNREIALRVTVGDRIAEVPVMLRVKPRMELALAPDHFPIMREPSAATEAKVTNHTHSPLSGELRLVPPEGWEIAPRTARVTLGPGETAAVPCRVRPPQFDPESLYDVHDADFSLLFEGERDRATRAVSVRLHMPMTWLVYCPLGTRPADVVRTGATPGGGFLSDIVFTVNAHPNHVDDARQAVTDAIARQRAGEQRVVLWFRTGGGKGSDQLADAEVHSLLRKFVGLGGGVIFQENLFRDSAANRALLQSDLCPVGGPYAAVDEPGGDWLVTEPEHPAIEKFARLVLEGNANWGIPQAARPPRTTVSVKPWATVVARNERGDPVVVVSNDPARPVAYIGGVIEGTYMADRRGTGQYPEQMPHLLYFYPELARWLSLAK